mmetsp:Transcript_3975/g.7153  ORF Transcript_3975/g.7153 Transcript_3975/m.7153 type:complete len:101 (-) Transcript_3975:24-326(-)
MAPPPLNRLHELPCIHPHFVLPTARVCPFSTMMVSVTTRAVKPLGPVPRNCPGCREWPEWETIAVEQPSGSVWPEPTGDSVGVSGKEQGPVKISSSPAVT